MHGHSHKWITQPNPPTHPPTPQQAADFATLHGIPRAFGSYAELCADPEVEVVYIGTLHAFHKCVCLFDIRTPPPLIPSTKPKLRLKSKPYTHNQNKNQRDHALLALAQGKHVLVEKPVACTAADAAEIVKEVRLSNVDLAHT